VWLRPAGDDGGLELRASEEGAAVACFNDGPGWSGFGEEAARRSPAVMVAARLGTGELDGAGPDAELGQHGVLWRCFKKGKEPRQQL
jgi:hypothetical protein